MGAYVQIIQEGDRIVLDRRRPGCLPKDHWFYRVYRGEYEMFYFIASKAMIKRIRRVHQSGHVYLGITDSDVGVAVASFREDIMEILISLNVQEGADWRPNETVPEDYYAL